MWDGWHNIADATVRNGAPTWVEYSLFIGIMLVLAAILFSLIALFYYVLYIRLTKKLYKNYKELIQLDH
jgi:ABC-type transport system involved in Fe-S cluster assembly fused permease/ATPase subunit